MKKRLLHILLFALCAIYLTACYSPRYMYSPNNTNVPNLDTKGDSKIAAYYSFGNNGSRGTPIMGENLVRNRGLDVQAAYAISNHIGVLFNHSTRMERNSGEFENLVDSAVINYRRRITELGIGYFGRFSKSNASARYQLFAGYGFGYSRFTDNGKYTNNVFYNRFHKADVRKIFLQPAVMVDVTKNFTTCFSSRINFVSFNNVSTDYTQPEQESYLLENLEGRTSVFWEPALINNFGFRKVPGFRFELQLGFASLVSREFIDYRTLNMSIGVMADLRRVFGKKSPASKTDGGK